MGGWGSLRGGCEAGGGHRAAGGGWRGAGGGRWARGGRKGTGGGLPKGPLGRGGGGGFWGGRRGLEEARGGHRGAGGGCPEPPPRGCPAPRREAGAWWRPWGGGRRAGSPPGGFLQAWGSVFGLPPPVLVALAAPGSKGCGLLTSDQLLAPLLYGDGGRAASARAGPGRGGCRSGERGAERLSLRGEVAWVLGEGTASARQLGSPQKLCFLGVF